MELTLEQERALSLAKARQRMEDEKSVMLRSDDKPNVKKGSFNAALDGLTFGFSDEIRASMKGASSALFGGPFSDSINRFNFERERDLIDRQIERDAFKRDHPNITMGSELGGGMASGGALWKIGSKLLLKLPPIARLAGVGATEGALFGAGTSLPGQRTEGSVKGGLLGAVGTPLTSGL